MRRALLRPQGWGIRVAASALFLFIWWRLFTALQGHPNIAWDFPCFWVAGNIRAENLHRAREFQEFGRQELEEAGVRYINPYVRPAVFSLPLRWLMRIPYWEAYRLWVGLQTAAFLMLLVLLCRRHGGSPIWIVAFALYFPAWFGTFQGQDAALVALALFGGLSALTKGRDGLGGFLWGLCVYKFNLVFGLPVLLALFRRWKALAVFAATAITAAAASTLTAPPEQYLSLLRDIPIHSVNFGPENIYGLRGLAHRLHAPWLYLPGALALAAATIWAARRTDLERAARLILSATLLTAYHVTWYDYTVYAIVLWPALVGRCWTERSAAIIVLGWMGFELTIGWAIVPVLLAFHAVSLYGALEMATGYGLSASASQTIVRSAGERYRAAVPGLRRLLGL